MRFDYLTVRVRIEEGPIPTDETLNKYGAQGYHLVQLFTVAGTTITFGVFEKTITGPRDAGR